MGEGEAGQQGPHPAGREAEDEPLWRDMAGLQQKRARLRKRFIGSSRCSSGWRGPTGTAGDENDPGDAEDGSSAHPKPQDGQQYSLEQVHYSP